MRRQSTKVIHSETATFETLFKIVFKQHKNTSQSNFNANHIYYHTEVPFGDTRLLKVSWIKIPTFHKEHKLRMYCVFIVRISYYRTGEIKQIWKQVIDTADNHDIDSYTIFLHGKLRGFVDPVANKPLNYYKTYLIHDKQPRAQNKRVMQFVKGFLTRRLRIMQSGGLLFGELIDDCKRMQKTIDCLEVQLAEYKGSYIIKETNI